MLIKRPADIAPSEITDEKLFYGRRQFIQQMSVLGLAAGGFGLMSSPSRAALAMDNIEKGVVTVDEELTSFKDITRYNNFYEFSTDKEGPARLATKFKTSPWTIDAEGEIAKPASYQLEDLIKPHRLQERIYRLRCVEAWSMVIPWVGVPLAEIIKRLQPTSKAKYVVFTTLYDPQQMPGQKQRLLPWPYVEGLRMDEAMHPLSILAVGLYGKLLPNQNGAPVRLVVPWKYGFKSIKSIVKISFSEQPPRTTWVAAGPREYGFYANVNPDVDHPRWSQSRERRIGEIFKRKTLMFNGYAEQVAGLYQGMDLQKFY